MPIGFNPLLAASPSWTSVSRSNHSTWFSPPFPRSEVFLFSALVFVVRVQEFYLLCVDLPETKGIVRCSCLLRDFGCSGVTWFLTSDQDRCEVCIVISFSLSFSVCCAPLVTPPRLVAVPIFSPLAVRRLHFSRATPVFVSAPPTAYSVQRPRPHRLDFAPWTFGLPRQCTRLSLVP
jgi:hypothetical protein